MTPTPSPPTLSHRVLALLVAVLLLVQPASTMAFGFDDVAELARQRALAPYRAPTPGAQAHALAGLSYDAYRRLRFDPAQAVWGDAQLPFELQFFPVGRQHRTALTLHEVLPDGQVRPLTVPRRAFGLDGAGAAEVAGWRLHYPIRRTDYKDEVVAFLGASYFRAVGADQRYGLSARALAVDSTGGGGEEFPAFESFWFERPAADSRHFVVHALLDSPRVTGAWRFEIRPGSETVVDVRARLYLRAPVAMLGLAPLTSMFLHGENQPRADDYRPEVHDSDGLQIATAGGEWIWRPLVNPRGVFVTSFALQQPRGFGLMQRDRNFLRYEDLEAHYERRPSLWVEPLPVAGGAGDAWAAGRVELLQFQTPDETHDNVGAFWVPASLPPIGAPLDVAWRLRWQGDAATLPPGARVLQSRRGVGYREGAVDPRRLQWQLDFDGEALRTLPAQAAVEAVVSADDNAEQLRAHAYPNPAQGGWRVTIDFLRRDARRPVELRAYLRADGRTLSETWSYALPPE